MYLKALSNLFVSSPSGGAVSYDPQRDLGRSSNRVQIFDPETLRWRRAAPMKYCRSFASAASDGDFVYVVGGEDENGRKLSSIERYDVKNDRWMVLTKMEKKLTQGSALTLKLEGTAIEGGKGLWKERDAE